MTNPPNKDKQSCLLKDTRQSKGITLEMVHESTKIPLDALKSIEQGYSVHKLQTFYYRGFIKIYTRFLELDETQVLQEYGMQESAAPKPQHTIVKEQRAPQSGEPKKFGKGVVRPVVQNDLLPRQSKNVLRFVIFLVAVFLCVKLGGCVMSKMKMKSPKETKVSKPKDRPAIKAPSKTEGKNRIKESPVKERDVSLKPAVAIANEVPVQPKPETSKSTVSETKSDKKSKAIEVTVRATKSGWLQVKADGQVVFQSTLKKGDAETWKAESEIELSGRNINLLEFELNGKMLGALGASDRGARKVVFTKDGLSVKK